MDGAHRKRRLVCEGSSGYGDDDWQVDQCPKGNGYLHVRGGLLCGRFAATAILNASEDRYLSSW